MNRLKFGQRNMLFNLDGSEYYSKCPEMFFSDGRRRIDFVLVYKAFETDTVVERKRFAFLSALAEQMIEMEIENCHGDILAKTNFSSDASNSSRLLLEYQQSNDSALCNVIALSSKENQSSFETTILSNTDLIFVKLHASWSTLIRCAEVLQFKKPLKQSNIQSLETIDRSKFKRWFEIDSKYILELPQPYRTVFSMTRMNLFEIPEDKSSFFTPSERIRVVDYVLKRAGPLAGKYFNETLKNMKQESKGELGIDHLIKDEVFVAAFPLHEPSAELMQLLREKKNAGPDSSKPMADSMETNMRTLLCDQWGNLRKIFKYQPLDYVRLYFGEAIAFYFAWLGFYTYWLIPVAIFGFLVFFHSAIYIFNNKVVTDTCIHGSEFVMCPQCNRGCHFWLLNASCLSVKMTYLMDSTGTVLFAICMSIWATLFIEYWKRYQNILAQRWNVQNLKPVDEPPRPEFIALLQKRGCKTKINKITECVEPKIPFWSKKVPFTLFSYVTVLFGVILCLAALIGVIFYRLIMNSLLRKNENMLIVSVSGLITTATSSFINLICIFILKLIYDRIAVKLTDIENHRTQSEYDNSLTLKFYLLQFVNLYSSIFYIAFIQGTTAALPGDGSVPIQSSGCDNGNCLFQLFIQLAIIMVGKQLLNFVTENGVPLIRQCVNARLARRRLPKVCRPVLSRKTLTTPIELGDSENHLLTSDVRQPILYNCLVNFNLFNGGSRPLFDEYIEMVIQYGFITMFVPAFPIAPLFALLNNMFEVRTDAKKFLHVLRRPAVVPEDGIGIWFGILVAISSLAIRTNACLIAFTSEFLERLTYIFYYSPNRSLEGYLNFTLSYMNASRFAISPKDALLLNNTEFCRYRNYREPPSSDHPYEYRPVHWHMLAIKFAFVFFFENIILALTGLISQCIPDMPEDIVIISRRETRVINELILQTGLIKDPDAEKPSEPPTNQSSIHVTSPDATSTNQVGFIYASPEDIITGV